MNWKKWLFGTIDYHNKSDDGRKEVKLHIWGGIIPNLLIWGCIAGLIWYFFFR